MEPFLKTGMMSASLSLSGNVPNERQLLKQNVRNGAHDLAALEHYSKHSTRYISTYRFLKRFKTFNFFLAKNSITGPEKI